MMTVLQGIKEHPSCERPSETFRYFCPRGSWCAQNQRELVETTFEIAAKPPRHHACLPPETRDSVASGHLQHDTQR